MEFNLSSKYNIKNFFYYEYTLETATDIEKGHITINSSNSRSTSTLSSIEDCRFTKTENSEKIDYISEIQPALHDNKKSCWETICKNIIIGNYDLTQNEYSKLNVLRKECISLYDEKNEKHEKLLEDFLDTYIELSKQNKKELKNKPGLLWKEIGFQVSTL